MTDPDLQHLADDSAAHELRVERARDDRDCGVGPRWQRIDGHLIDVGTDPVVPSRPDYNPFAEDPPPSAFPTGTMTHAEAEEVAAQVKAITAAAAPVECCAACGRPLIGVNAEPSR